VDACGGEPLFGLCQFAAGCIWHILAESFFNTDLNVLDIFGNPEMLVCNGM